MAVPWAFAVPLFEWPLACQKHVEEASGMFFRESKVKHVYTEGPTIRLEAIAIGLVLRFSWFLFEWWGKQRLINCTIKVQCPETNSSDLPPQERQCFCASLLVQHGATDQWEHATSYDPETRKHLLIDDTT